MESEVAAQVADALQVRLLPREKQQLATAPTRNPQAHDALLKGEAPQQRAEVTWQKVDIDAAIAAFQQATAADPQHALANARLAYAYVWTVNYLTASGKSADKAVPILDQLLGTDQGQAISIGRVRTEVDWDPIRGDPAFKHLLRQHAAIGT